MARGIMWSLPEQRAVLAGESHDFSLQSAIGKEDHIFVGY
jgi:hypothetical protein